MYYFTRRAIPATLSERVYHKLSIWLEPLKTWNFHLQVNKTTTAQIEINTIQFSFIDICTHNATSFITIFMIQHRVWLRTRFKPKFCHEIFSSLDFFCFVFCIKTKNEVGFPRRGPFGKKGLAPFLGIEIYRSMGTISRKLLFLVSGFRFPVKKFFSIWSLVPYGPGSSFLLNNHAVGPRVISNTTPPG